MFCFCGEEERDSKMKVASKFFDSVEYIYWYKPNAQCTGLNRHVKSIETAFLAYKCTTAGNEGELIISRLLTSYLFFITYILAFELAGII